MNLRIIQSAALLLWGYQSELLLFAIPMALIWEARFFFNRRWALTKQDFYLLSDLTSVCLVLMIVFLFINRTDYHFIRTLMQWLPILFYPLAVTVGYSTTPRLPLDALFYSLRRQKQPVDRAWDMDYLLFGFLLVGSATSKELGTFFFPIMALLVFWSLLPLRSNRHSSRTWVLITSLIFLTAFVTHSGIRESHLELRKRAQVWLADWIQQRTNPLKTQTSIGQVGRLKVSDEILFRIKTEPNHPAPGFLQEAVYDLSFDNSWAVVNQQFDQVKHIDDFLWNLEPPSHSDTHVDIYHEFHRENEIIPLPPGTTVIQDLPALNIQKNPYGSVQGLELVPSPRYQIKYQTGSNFSAPPDQLTDLSIRAERQPLLERVVRESKLNPNKPLDSLFEFYRDFRYSMYQPNRTVADPLEHFLLHRKAGHCEYFASTTVLLLRQMGVPARYVTGYAIQEYDDLLEMYVVRQRHAHAWAIAYIDNQWKIVDTTPGIWLEAEAQQETFLRPMLDRLSNLNFLFQVWWNDQTEEDIQPFLFGLGLLLTLVLIWRISTSEQVKIEQQISIDDSIAGNKGPESPLELLEQSLTKKGYARLPGEVFATWLGRIGFWQFLTLVPLHNRLRFHPNGLTKEDQTKLAESVARGIEELEAQDVGRTD